MSGSLFDNSSRRGFLKQIGRLSAASLSSQISVKAWASDSTAGDAKIGDVFKNRTPLAPSAFYPLPLGSIRPAGWLLSQLKIQANGLSGRLDETWPDVGPNSGWLGGTGEAWERGPYFLDGLIPLAYLLDDAVLYARVQQYALRLPRGLAPGYPRISRSDRGQSWHLGTVAGALAPAPWPYFPALPEMVHHA